MRIWMIVLPILLLLKSLTQLVGNVLLASSEDSSSFLSSYNVPPVVWSKEQIQSHMSANPQRCYFAHLFALGGFRRGIEIGVQDGRYSEVLLDQNFRLLRDSWSLVLVDPHPTPYLKERLGLTGKTPGTWEKKGYLKNANVTFEKTTALHPKLLSKYADEYFDFVYLDGLHEHNEVRKEVSAWWKKVRPGGVLAGHDYCNYGEKGLSCNRCKDIPRCKPYTSYGFESARAKKGWSANQNGVVMAIQQWMVEDVRDSSIEIHHTVENFTSESLAKDGFEFLQVISNNRNPSWFIVKPS